MLWYLFRVQIFDLDPGMTTANAAWGPWNLGSVHQVHLTPGWTEAVWNEKFVQHFYTLLALGI